MVAPYPHLWLDGRFVRADAAAVSAAAPGLLRGEGLFETIACESGAPLLLPLHGERLKNSAAALGLSLRLGPRALAGAIAETLARNRTREANARLMLVKGARRDAVAILCRRLVRPSAGDYRRGVALVVAPWRRAPGNPLDRHKTLNCWEHHVAREDARRRGAFDALFLAPDGAVLEGSATNVFLVRRGELLTPPVSRGLLPGVMRRFVIEACRVALGLRAREADFTLRDLRGADEVFVTNAIVGALPVARIEGRRLERLGDVAGACRRVYAACRRSAPEIRNSKS